MSFTQGHALIIGVGRYHHIPGADVPIAVDDARAVEQVITVAILTTSIFDALSVDHTTVMFEGASETHRDRKSGAALRHEEDLDGDGDLDLVFHFRLDETYLTCYSRRAWLHGFTYAGQQFSGTDLVQIIGGG